MEKIIQALKEINKHDTLDSFDHETLSDIIEELEYRASDFNITVNHLASELADQAVLNKYEDETYRIDENGDTTYTDVAQDMFNNMYDYYYELIKSTQSI
jgi:hypothetical protein